MIEFIKDLGSSHDSTSVCHVTLDKLCQRSVFILSFFCLAVTEGGKALEHKGRSYKTSKSRIPIFSRVPQSYKSSDSVQILSHRALITMPELWS